MVWEQQELPQEEQAVTKRKKRKCEEDVANSNSGGQGGGADADTKRQDGSGRGGHGLAGGALRSTDPVMRERIRQMQRNRLGVRVTWKQWKKRANGECGQEALAYWEDPTASWCFAWWNNEHRGIRPAPAIGGLM